MSHRPIEQKQRRRVAKALRRSTRPTSFDLIEYLMSRGYANTKREAREMILAKRVKSESHILGVKQAMVPGPKSELELALGREVTMVQKDVVAPIVPSSLRRSITVSE